MRTSAGVALSEAARMSVFTASDSLTCRVESLSVYRFCQSDPSDALCRPGGVQTSTGGASESSATSSTSRWKCSVARRWRSSSNRKSFLSTALQNASTSGRDLPVRSSSLRISASLQPLSRTTIRPLPLERLLPRSLPTTSRRWIAERQRRSQPPSPHPGPQPARAERTRRSVSRRAAALSLIHISAPQIPKHRVQYRVGRPRSTPFRRCRDAPTASTRRTREGNIPP